MSSHLQGNGRNIGLSINAVHKRVQNMLDSGLNLGFTAIPSLIALKGLEILIFGIAKAKNLDELSRNLGEDERIYVVGLAAGNVIYVVIVQEFLVLKLVMVVSIQERLKKL